MNNLLELNWKQKNHSMRRVNDDVTISIANTKGKGNRVQFIFRNEIEKIFCETGFVTYAIYKNRIFLKGCERNEGFKLCECGSKTSKFMAATLVSEEETELMKSFIGDYELQYDSFYELHFVEKKVD